MGVHTFNSTEKTAYFHYLWLFFSDYCKKGVIFDEIYPFQCRVYLATSAAYAAPINRPTAVKELMNIFGINKLQIFCFMYKINKQLLPSFFFLNIYSLNSSISDHNTRQAPHLHVNTIQICMPHPNSRSQIMELLEFKYKRVIPCQVNQWLPPHHLRLS